jgi:hypothetical protein
MTMPPDASKVKAHGPGLENGVVTDYQEITKEDSWLRSKELHGAGTLKIKIHGPKLKVLSKSKCSERKPKIATSVPVQPNRA